MYRREEEETKRRQLSLISSMPANLQRWELRRFHSATALLQYCFQEPYPAEKGGWVCVCVWTWMCPQLKAFFTVSPTIDVVCDNFCICMFRTVTIKLWKTEQGHLDQNSGYEQNLQTFAVSDLNLSMMCWHYLDQYRAWPTFKMNDDCERLLKRQCLSFIPLSASFRQTFIQI